MKHQTHKKQLCRELATRLSISQEETEKISDMNHKWAKIVNNNGHRQDLESIGWIEIIKTIDMASLSRGAKASTCCYWPIRKAMTRAMQ